jgi:hypothetical protein
MTENSLIIFVAVLSRATGQSTIKTTIPSGDSGFENEADAPTIKSARYELVGSPTYQSSADQKQRSGCFRIADGFVLSTRYETKPYVLVGQPVISFDRGCIIDIVDPSAGHLVPRDADWCPATPDTGCRPCPAGETAARAVPRLYERAVPHRALAMGMTGQ